MRRIRSITFADAGEMVSRPYPEVLTHLTPNA
jgi:hypothetical protein